MGVTIKEIAEIADVSRGTVDKVLNNRSGVSDKVREKVQKIADKLGYEPNIIGKALAYQKNPLIIGVIIPPEEIPFFDDIKKGLEAVYKELKDYGIRIEYRAMKSHEAEEQLEIIKSFRDQAISGLALTAIDHEMIRDEINDLVDHNIPVVTFNSDIQGSKRMCFVGQDLVKSGKVAGELMGKIISEQGKVAIITGAYNILAHNQRIEGFKDIIEKKSGNLEIARIVENREKDSLSYKIARSFLEDIDNLKGIFITASGVKGAGKAIQESGKGDEIKVISYDFVPETVKLLKEGIVDFTIGQEPFEQGYRPIKILFNYLFKNKRPESEYIFTKIDIRVKENIDL